MPKLDLTTPSRPSDEGPRWQRRKIEIEHKDHSKHPTVAACYGSVGVNKEESGGVAYWYVTVLSVGLCACRVRSEDEAKKIGAYLQARCTLALRETEQKKVVERFKPWVVPWLKECTRQEKFVDPSEVPAPDPKKEES